MTTYSYNSLDDFLKSHRLDVDGLLDDGGGAPFPVKGRIIDAVVLFADMTAFSTRSSELSPVETLIFVNNFIAWISAEGLKERHGIVDKYIGDEMMAVFSKDFGSADPLADAVNAARWMVENDTLGFSPHVGIAAGEVVVGYVGTPMKYDCSVFGSPVTLAQRCCQIKERQGSIVIPASTWAGRQLEQVLTKRKLKQPDGRDAELDVSWRMFPPERVNVKHQELEIVQLGHEGIRAAFQIPLDGGPVLAGEQATAQERAKRAFEGLKRAGDFKPRRYSFEPIPEFFTKRRYP
jgi:class 3 adenylate cyclase